MFKRFQRDLDTFLRKCTATHAIIFLASIVVGAIAVHMALNWTLAKAKEGYEGRKELLLLHMEGCPHCVELMPEWDNFAKKNDTNIATRKVERKEDPALVSKHGVQGFPAILLLDGTGEKMETYEGPRTSAGLLDFCRKKA